MVGRSKKTRTNVVSDGTTGIANGALFTQNPSAPATAQDKRLWKGFCEIESEPAFFNLMLKRFGVRGVKVREIISLDDAILSFLPQPVYGLIFLFKWVEEDPNKQEQSCPEGIWFANQTINNACASVALLNIVNNVPGIELGENLQHFKEFTSDFSPALRGDAIGNFDFVKEIHNAFARKIDMLNADLLLKNEASEKCKAKRRKFDEHDNEAGFHFIAFLPIDDRLWKLDGLERQPMCLGDATENWLSQAKPDIEARMAQYEEGQIEFAILSLVQDPLPKLVSELAENVQSISTVTHRLNTIKPDWEDFLTLAANDEYTRLLQGPDEAYGLTQKIMDSTTVPMAILEHCDFGVVSELTHHFERLVTDQAGLRLAIKEELQTDQADEEKAVARECDFGARMQNFVRVVRTKKQASADAMVAARE
ncbi:hypothetical protein MMC21_007362 [Puttea exsequens]|nr:hypothetical protein [Puttea exsequens]